MAMYRITAHGCDDATTVDLELTDDEVAVARKLAEAITAYGGGCKPRVSLRPHTDASVRAELDEEAAERAMEAERES